MATTTITTLFVLCCVLLASIMTSAQSPAAAPETSAASPGPAAAGGGSDDCFATLANMSDCLTYVESGSKEKKPTKTCCDELSGVVNTNPLCLCQLLAKPEFAGVKLDLNKAVKLPSVCSVSTPPLSTCSLVGVPVSLPPSSEDSTSPSGQPINAPATSPSNQATPTASPGSQTSPSEIADTNPQKNEAISIKFSALPFVLAVVSIFF